MTKKTHDQKEYGEISSSMNFMPTEKSVLDIMKERAINLAKIAHEKNKNDSTIDFIHFELGQHQHYGISYRYTNEVLRNIALTKLPQTPDFIAGIINRRGVLLSVINLKKFFQLDSRMVDYTEEAYIIIVTSKNMTVGILTDQINGSDRYQPETLDASMRANSIIKPEYILGLHKGSMAILNIDAILTDIQGYIDKKFS